MNKNSNSNLLDSLAPFYENIWAPIGMLISARKRYSKILKEAADFLDSGYILDLGAGTGKLADFISSTYYALDISENFLRVLKKKRKEKDAIRADANHLPFKYNSFNGIAMMFLIHLIEDKKTLIENIKKLLKKDGKLVFTALCKGGILSRILTKWWKVKPLSEKEYIELLENAGFKIFESKKIGVWLFVKCVYA